MTLPSLPTVGGDVNSWGTELNTYLTALEATVGSAAGVFDVTDYGAVGNDSHDDQPNIQAAINAAAPVGGWVYLPGLVYKLGAPLDFSACNGTGKGIRFGGHGSGSVNTFAGGPLLKSYHGGSVIKSIAADIYNYPENVTLENFGILHTQNMNDLFWSIDCQGHYYGLKISQVVIDLADHVGNGMRNTIVNGSWLISQCAVHNAYPGASGHNGIGFEHGDGFDNLTGTHLRRAGNPWGYPVDTAAWATMSGQGSYISCFVANENTVAFQLVGDIVGVAYLGCTVGTSFEANSIGLNLTTGNAGFCAISGCCWLGGHIEGGLTGIKLANGAVGNWFQTMMSAGTVGVLCDGQSNTFDITHDTSVATGVSFTTNAAGNWARNTVQPGATVATPFVDTSTAQTNTQIGADGSLRIGTNQFLGNGAIALNGTGSIVNKYTDIYEAGTAPSPAANTVRFFAQDNGSGKTQLCYRFPTGTYFVLATEP